MGRFRFTVMPLDVEYANATSNGYMPMIKWHFGDHARGFILGDDGIIYANFDDRTKDKKASWAS